MEPDRTLVHEFTHQAGAFAQAAVFRGADTLDALLDRLPTHPNETWCDVACGPGIVACALARRVRQVIGIDRTPAMLTAAAAEADRQGVRNVRWLAGDAQSLPLAPTSCDGIVSRFALHHLPDPAAAVAEMARVVCGGGTVAVADHCTAEQPEAAAWHQQIERWRDPSHQACLTPAGLRSLGVATGLEPVAGDERLFELDYEEWLTRGSGGPSRREAISALFAAPPPGADRVFARIGDRLRARLTIVVWRRPATEATTPESSKEERP